MLFVLLVAAVFRAVYFAQVSRTLGFARPMVDAMDYERMARGIVDGSWPGDSVFFVDPLYAYWIAGWRGLFGGGTSGILVGQMIVGTIGAGAMFVLASRFLRPAGALMAGLFAATYGALVFFEALELKTSLAVFGVTGFLLALVKARRSANAWSFVAGVVLGAGTLLRGNLLALGPLGALWLVFAGEGKGRWKRVAALCAGTLLALAPATVHNLRAGDLVLTTSNLGANLYTGNGAHNTTGSYVPPPGVRASPVFEEEDFRRLAEEAEGRELAPSEVSRHWVARTLAEAREDPGRVAQLLGKKALLFLNAVEIPDNESYGKTREEVAILRAPLPNFALLLVLAAAAVALIRWRPEHVLALGVFCIVGLTVTVFFVNARFRMTAVPGLILLAAALPEGIARVVSERRFVRGALAVVLAALALRVTTLDVYDVSTTMLDYNDAVLALEAGDLDRSLRSLERAIDEEPKNWRAEILRGDVLRRQGDFVAARRAFEHATQLAPRAGEAWVEFGLFLSVRGELWDAEQALTKALRLESTDPVDRERATLQLADVERRMEKLEAARSRLQAFLAERPRRAQGWYLLGRVELDAHEAETAEAALRRAVELKPKSTRFRAELADFLRRTGRREEAREQYRALLELDPTNESWQLFLTTLGG